MHHTAITHEQLEKIAEEANSDNATKEDACRSFCARLIGHVAHDDQAYASSIAGLLHMPNLIRDDERAAA